MLKIAFLNLFRFKARTVLSVLGIVIGLTAIIGMVSIVDGIYFDVQEVFSKIQGIMVRQEGTISPLWSVLDESWVNKLETVPGVDVAHGSIIDLAKSVEGKSYQFSLEVVRLVGQDWSKVKGESAAGVQGEIIAGKMFKGGEKKQAVIGRELAEEFNKFVGNNIKINGKKFRVIGVFETGSTTLNKSVLLPIEDMREITGYPKGKIRLIIVDPVNPDELNKVMNLIEFKYGDDLKAVAASDISEQIGDVMSNLRLVAFLVAAISAVVAGVGIMNTMLMSVMERFREIGALKAVGWTNWNIMKMVLYESLFIGLIGAIIGSLLGYGVAEAIEVYSGISTTVTAFLILQAFAFAVAVSIMAGAYPAYAAARMNVIDALRME